MVHFARCSASRAFTRSACRIGNPCAAAAISTYRAPGIPAATARPHGDRAALLADKPQRNRPVADGDNEIAPGYRQRAVEPAGQSGKATAAVDLDP